MRWGRESRLTTTESDGEYRTSDSARTAILATPAARRRARENWVREIGMRETDGEEMGMRDAWRRCWATAHARGRHGRAVGAGPRDRCKVGRARQVEQARQGGLFLFLFLSLFFIYFIYHLNLTSSAKTTKRMHIQ